MDKRPGWKRQPPSSMRTSTPSMPRSSSCSTRRCAASRSPSAAGSCLPLPTKPRPSACAAACRDGRRASSVRNSIFVGGHFKDYQRLGDAAIKVLGDFTPLVERISIDEAFADVAGCTHLFGPPAEIAQRDPPPRAGRAWPADLGRRGAHQASGEDRLAGGQARRAGGRRSRHRTRVPARPARRADVGRRSGHQGAAGRDRRADHRAAGARRRDGRSSGCSVRRRARSSQRWPGIAIRAKSRRIAGRDRPARSRRSAGSLPRSGSSGRRCVISPTGSAPGSGPSPGPAEP